MDNESKMDWIYSQLEDEESRFIYQNQRLFRQNNDYRYIYDIIDKYAVEFSANKWYPNKEEEFFSRIKKTGKRVVVFGAGIRGQKICNICANMEIPVDFFCDSNAALEEARHHGKLPVITPNKLNEYGLLGDHIIIVSPRYGYGDIVNMLLDIGGDRGNIFVYADCLRDSLEKQYFEDGIIQFEENEVFIDAGCYDFDTSKIFISKMHGLGLKIKKIYAFEPDPVCFCKCKNRADLVGFNDIELVQAGVWSSDSYISFEALGNDSSHIVQNGEVSSDLIRTTTLDSYIKEKVSFIKMDVEGAELEALKGAKNIILRDKPKLAICLYHKEEDMWEIPYYIKTLVPEYKLYIRHYSNCETETVLYAVLKKE